ncbi:NADPH-dependent FMN reductase [Sphingomonas sp.]|jgi:chromate reductase|uniref:NADPH-dependent FMN reductase n=1 Tax=Sphingomonas sp. TaxID=28214 RepID=UPI0035C7C2C7
MTTVSGAAAGGPPRLLGMSGSLRAQAYSTTILQALAETAAAAVDTADIGALPHFDQDLYVDPLPPTVARLRAQVEAADGLLIVSPEYNHGIPGVLKNALDWASRPHNASPLCGKPALIITSSLAFTGGVRAQYQIRETLVSALARPVAFPEIVIGNVGDKIVEGALVRADVLDVARAGVAALLAEIAALRARAG